MMCLKTGTEATSSALRALGRRKTFAPHVRRKVYGNQRLIAADIKSHHGQLSSGSNVFTDDEASVVVGQRCRKPLIVIFALHRICDMRHRPCLRVIPPKENIGTVVWSRIARADQICPLSASAAASLHTACLFKRCPCFCQRVFRLQSAKRHSHSIVPGGFEVIS